MITRLQIKNYALIKELEIEPSSGFNTITGETGAGKSIMLGAVGLLLGKRADTKVLYDEGAKCVVEGHFQVNNYDLHSFFDEHELDYEEHSIIRREISASGKSRAFINDTPVTLDILRGIGAKLVDIHSQHETLLLADNQFQLDLIDSYADTKKELTDYKSAYFSSLEAHSKLKSEEKRLKKLQEEQDYNQFLFEELSKENLKTDEQEELENRLKRLENAELIQSSLANSFGQLDEGEFSALKSLHQVTEEMRKIEEIDAKYANIYNRLNSSLIELQDIGKELEIENNNFEYDPDEIEAVQERLSTIYRLQKKHGVATIERLIEIQEQLENDLLAITDSNDYLKQLTAEHKELKADMLKKANTLSAKRAEAINPLSTSLSKLLADLGMPNASVKVDQRQIEAVENGIDEFDILFTANKGVEPQHLRKVASGGEFSRLMFAIKHIMADKVAMPTLIFDEIDTGISGEIALKMVAMMKNMAERHQIISISHLPQIAAKGHKHYFVYKDNSADLSVSKIKLLEEEERVLEIAKMISGEQPTNSAMESARELLKA